MDVLADKVGIPVVPFVKAGLNWYLWWVHKGGSVPSENGEKASGGTPGWQFSTGAMFRLDDLDRISARTFDNEAGVNHSYLFAEILWAVVDRFGDNSYLNLSTDTAANATFLFEAGSETSNRCPAPSPYCAAEPWKCFRRRHCRRPVPITNPRRTVHTSIANNPVPRRWSPAVPGARHTTRSVPGPGASRPGRSHRRVQPEIKVAEGQNLHRHPVGQEVGELLFQVGEVGH